MISVYKPLGLTPLETIQRIKEQVPSLQKQKVSYAGRLDPMAEGLLLLLVGDENKKRKDYENLPKIYEFEVLFGIETDTYDLLGRITQTSNQQLVLSRHEINSFLPNFLGTYKQPYPPYSSKPVQGKPLYRWAREGKLGEIQIPEREITITSLSLLSEASLSPATLADAVKQRITNVTGDFRQEKILATWDDYLTNTSLLSFPLFTFSIACSSGTYVRSLAYRLGRVTVTGALAFSIKRTGVGTFTLDDALYLEPQE